MRITSTRAVSSNTALSFLARLLALAIIGFSSLAQAASIYIAQSAAGTGDGSSCANARAVSWFNTGSNWGSGGTQISPGSTVYLCGTITSDLNFQGSGTSGSVITVDGSAATMSASFAVSNRSHWRIQNIRWTSGFTRTLLRITGGSNGVFTNSTADGVSGDPAVFLAQGSSLPTHITISKNTIRTTASDLGNTQLDIIKTEGSGNVTIEGNTLEMRAGGSGSYAHDDCIQTYEKGGTSLGGPSNWTIRNNRIIMNSNATNDRSWLMLEGLSGTINIDGNVFLGLRGADGANGISSSLNKTGVVFNIFNNTFIAKGTASNNVMNLGSPGTAYIRNNIIDAVNQTVLTGSMTTVRDNNLWHGSNIPACGSGDYCRQSPPFKDYANNDFSLTAALPGVALAAIYNRDLVGNTRGTDGAWDVGAFEYIAGGGTLPSPTPSASPQPNPSATPTATPIATSTQTLFSTQAPTSLNNSDGANVNYELGLRFMANTPGRISGIRFYKSPSERGTHVGKIYSASGQLLAQVTFTNETASGWQTATLATPIAITAGTEYTVSVNTGSTYYVATVYGLASQISRGNLRSIVGNNGVFGSVGAKPTRSWNNTNYFRDVLFVPNP